MSSSKSLVLPLTFPTPSKFHDGEGFSANTRNLMELSCSRARPTSLVSWGFPVSHADIPSRGVAMGCDDGSLYIFHRSTKTARADALPPDNIAEISILEPASLSKISTPQPAHRHRHPTSRSASPSSLAHSQSPFNITPRSRIVSGISKEQVEAPKNYVDFEDEPEKLKEMLKAKSPKDRTTTDALSPIIDKGLSLEQSASLSRSSSPPSLSQGPISMVKDDGKSLLSTMNSPLLSPKSPSTTSSSPNLTPLSFDSSEIESLYLRCHILPRRSGLGTGIVEIQVLEDNGILLILQESGDVSAFKAHDGTCIKSLQINEFNMQHSLGGEEAVHEVWIWKRLQTYVNGESTILLASATVDSVIQSASLETQNNEDQEKARLILFEFFPGDEHGLFESRLQRMGEWCVNGSADSVGLHRQTDNDFTFFYINPQGHMITQSLQFSPRGPPLQSQIRETTTHNRLPNPFKALHKRSPEEIPNDEDVVERIHLDDPFDNGELLSQGSTSAVQTRSVEGKLRGVAWSDHNMIAFQLHGKSLQISLALPIVGIQKIVWLDDSSFCVAAMTRAERYNVIAINKNNDETGRDAELVSESSHLHIQQQQTKTLELSQYQAIHLAFDSEVLSTFVDKCGRRQIKRWNSLRLENESNPSSQILWKASHEKEAYISTKIQLTSILPLEIELIILGLSDGFIRRSSLAELSKVSSRGVKGAVSDSALDSSITRLHIVENARTKQPFIVGGADDGTVAFWALDSLKLCARWTIFTSPFLSVVQFPEQRVGPLRGCALCVSQDGTIAVIVIDGFQFLYLIPGSAAPLQRLCLGSNNLLLIYSDRRARLWDVHTAEFWRSMSLDKAEELFSQGGWMDLLLEKQQHSSNNLFHDFYGVCQSPDTASTLLLDMENFVTSTLASIKSMGGSAENKQKAPFVLARLRSVLSVILTPGLNEEIDAICREKLRIPISVASVGSSSCGSNCLFGSETARDQWSLSSDLSASRALSVVASLRAFALTDEASEDCNTVVAFYAASLSQLVGVTYQPPSLVSLARQWFESSNELRQAARILFDAGVTRLSDNETNVLAEQWRHDLPCLQPDAEKQSMFAALALFLSGYIAAEKYSLISTSALVDIAKSITMYLHDEQSLHRVLAIDLCSRGFQIWQHYVDAMEILRALFTLATNSRKDAISTQNVGAQARLAVLQIVSSNTPLFMTTLALDILSPRSMEHRKSVMQLLAFLIRKRPLVIYPNLPRLTEAVVKSLDPNSTSSRDALLDAATEILGHVVKTFPTVDFHMPTQRLAVGSNEGAVVMYDLKTGTRLYVLEGHKKKLAACSFSPDGRSFTSFFNPGAPPRQGHGGSEPFKTLGFNVGDEASMTIAETLEWVRFEWSAERSVKLKIRDSVLTFST